ncbi:MAG: hypothetical protein AAF587_00850 [Bacteroidota bacterium]
MVPTEILETFDRDFPEAGPQNWQMLSDDLYVAKFLLRGFVQKAHYNAIGSWQYTDIEVAKNDLPEGALDHYDATYKQFPVASTGFHDALSGSYYFIEIFRGGVKRKLKYDEEGNFLE